MSAGVRMRTALVALLGLVLTGCASVGAVTEAGTAHGASPAAQGPAGAGQLRTYYIAAEEVVWDYAPSGRDQITGRPFDETAKVFVQRGPGRIGSRYLKALYRGYTDATFRTMTAARPAEAPLGLLGPVIRAEVGDTVRAVFRNRASFATSIHAHGVFYDKASEGAPYADGTPGGGQT